MRSVNVKYLGEVDLVFNNLNLFLLCVLHSHFVFCSYLPNGVTNAYIEIFDEVSL